MKSILQYVLGGLMIIVLTASGTPSFSQNRSLHAMNDTIDLYPGIPLVFDILANDTIPANDTIKAVIFGSLTGGGQIQVKKSHDASWKWTFTFTVLSWGYAGESSIRYRIYDLPLDTSSALVIMRVHDNSFSYLEINNVKARFAASGNHFFHDSAQYEVPKGSGKTSLFSNALWIGGLDGQGQLHFAGERYRQGPSNGPAGMKPDFYAGPVMDSAKYSIYLDTVWNHIWNLKKSEIDYHRAHYWEQGYTPIHDILTWPANGDTTMGQAPNLAPFCDRNADGIFDPFDGDYPEIRGDQALFFIFNDDRGPHLESSGTKLRIEIHGMAYAFDMPQDSAMNNTVFLYYKIFNRSENTYVNTLFGIFTDIDLGYANDDYIGCDVERNMYYGYNGLPVDGTGQNYAYGSNPPTQSVTLLAGPYMEPDGIDNPRYSNTGTQLCDFSVNGLNFGDSIVDNERYGLQEFLYFNNSNAGVPAYMTDPNYAPDYYLFLNGVWKDYSRMIYGGNGHISSGGYGPSCRFMFPGESDTLNWGVGCVQPNGPVEWTETTAQNNPQDRRGVGVTGPITFHPGEVQAIELAFSWARDYNGGSPLSSLQKLRQMTDIISKAFATNTLPNGEPFYGINDQDQKTGLQIDVYPNPASDHLVIRFAGENTMTGISVELMNSQGNCIKKLVNADPQKLIHLDVADVPAGFYFIRATTKDSRIVKKVIVIH